MTTAITTPISEATAWNLLLALRHHVRTGTLPVEPMGFGFDHQGAPTLVPSKEASIVLGPESAWVARVEVAAAAAQLFDLYLPVCLASAQRPLTVAHLGQSLDGRIATETGASCYVTGPANILHLHRMRALCDAILVGAATVQHDNPQLTTRRVTGSNPTRVILDKQLRLPADSRVFQDSAAPTLVFCDAASTQHAIGQAQVIGVPTANGQLSLAAILQQLHRRKLHAVFIEGGGITVSRFLQEGLLDKLQVTVAPLLIGSGRPSITLPVIHDLKDGLRLRRRIFTMGDDILFDCTPANANPSS